MTGRNNSSGLNALGTLRRDFERAYERWPGLHHLFIQFDLKTAYESGFVDCNLFLGSYPRIVVRPLIGDRVIIDCSISLHDSQASDRLAFTVAVDDPPGDQSALRHFRELALSACRILFPNILDSFSNAYGHRSFWPDHWLGEMYTLGQKHRDPLLHVREHRLEVAEDRNEFRLSPGYSAPMPSGDAIGHDGRSLPWHELLTRLATYGLTIDILEPGVFRASIHAINRIKDGDWVVSSGEKTKRKARKPQPAQLRAAASYEWVCREKPDLMPTNPNHKYSRKQWEYIRENGCPAYKDEEGNSLPISEYRTWKRQVRGGLADPNHPKVTSRANRPHGKSIVRDNQI